MMFLEHRVQMIRDAQTHTLPQTEEGFDRLAAMMDMDVPALRSDLERRLEEVHQLTEGFFAGSTSRPDAAAAPEEADPLDAFMADLESGPKKGPAAKKQKVQEKAPSEPEVDPLDAFMVGINSEAAARAAPPQTVAPARRRVRPRLRGAGAGGGAAGARAGARRRGGRGGVRSHRDLVLRRLRRRPLRWAARGKR